MEKLADIRISVSSTGGHTKIFRVYTADNQPMGFAYFNQKTNALSYESENGSIDSSDREKLKNMIREEIAKL